MSQWVRELHSARMRGLQSLLQVKVPLIAEQQGERGRTQTLRPPRRGSSQPRSLPIRASPSLPPDQHFWHLGKPPQFYHDPPRYQALRLPWPPVSSRLHKCIPRRNEPSAQCTRRSRDSVEWSASSRPVTGRFVLTSLTSAVLFHDDRRNTGPISSALVTQCKRSTFVCSSIRTS
jgi:hypothetical protein